MLLIKVPICHRSHRHRQPMAKFAAGLIDTGVVDTGGAPRLANISANFRKKIEMVLILFSGALEKMIHEKT